MNGELKGANDPSCPPVDTLMVLATKILKIKADVINLLETPIDYITCHEYPFMALNERYLHDSFHYMLVTNMTTRPSSHPVIHLRLYTVV